MMKRYLLISFIVLAGAVSCEKHIMSIGPVARSSNPICFSTAFSADTKGFIDSTVMPDTYTIYLSAYLSDDGKPSNTGNYFTSVPYKFNRVSDSLRIWTGNPPQYWPLSGTMGFLGIASEIEGLELQWSDMRNTDGVTVALPETFDGSSEVLYGVTDLYPKEVEHVPINFNHTQALLEFNFKSECDGIVQLADIVVKEAYSSGKLYVSNYPVSYAKWDTDDYDMSDIHISSIEPETYLDKGNDKKFGIAIIPKSRQYFTVTFRQRANIECDWEDCSVEIPFEYDMPLKKWKAGVKYRYNFDIRADEITFTAKTDSLDINIRTDVSI